MLHSRMTPYGVVSTGKDLGVIETVRDSSTIMKIQQKNGIRSAVQINSLGLYNWILNHNKDRSVSGKKWVFLWLKTVQKTPLGQVSFTFKGLLHIC